MIGPSCGKGNGEHGNDRCHRSRRARRERQGNRPTTQLVAAVRAGTTARSSASTSATTGGSPPTSTGWSTTTPAPRTSRRTSSSRRCAACARPTGRSRSSRGSTRSPRTPASTSSAAPSRAEEVSYDADEGLGAADYGRLVTTGPTPDVAVEPEDVARPPAAARSAACPRPTTRSSSCASSRASRYREIGERLGMSRPSVESTLFRARRRLTEEYDELVTGERCRRIQAIIATRGDRRARRARPAPHGAPRLLLPAVPAPGAARRPRRRACSSTRPVRAKIAAFLPLPAFLKRRWGGGGDDVSGVGSDARPDGRAVVLAVSDPSTAGWVKAAATAATIAIAGAGAGAVTQGDAASLSKRFARANAASEDERAGQEHAPRPARSPRPRRSPARPGGGAASAARLGRSKTTTHVSPLSSGTSGSGTSGTAGTTTVSAPSAPTDLVARERRRTCRAPAAAAARGRRAAPRATSAQAPAPVQNTVDNVTVRPSRAA